MPSDYKKIREENIKKYGTEINVFGPTLLANLYSDPTHFIYELLQNAEDAGATEVKFRLYKDRIDKDRLELEHNGQAFDEADVRGICGLVAGTKKGDLTKIGKFGIGFKSVYAHTQSPEIHSEDEHFAIDNYVQPYSICPRSSVLGTLFVFPFNHEEKDPDESFDEISKRLKELGASTLLFLKHIESIEYNIDKEVTGTYLRQTDPVKGTDFVSDITVIGQRNLHDEEERWLVFEKDVTHLADSIPEDKRLTVEIAFQYSDDDSQDAPKFQHLPQSNMVVYFPTEKETHLGFLIQGPYQTTPARDNVKSTEFNKALSEQTGDLVVEALRWLQKRNWLTVKILMTMPLQFQRVPPLFEPVYYKVLSAIKDEDLIPAYGGGYVSGKNAKLAGSRELRNLLDNARLRQFCNTDDQLRWISDEIPDQTLILRQYLREQVGIEEIDAEKFARRIDKDFLSRQSDDNWVCEFYEFASGRRGIHYILKNKPIIRLQDGNHVAPFDRYSDKPNAYLPTEHGSQFPTVKTEVCNSSDKAMEFLRNLGLKKPDIIDEARELILPEYKRGEVGRADIDTKTKHWEYTRTIVEALRKALRLDEWDKKRTGFIDTLKKIPFLLATNAEGVKEFCCPEEMIYFRSPELEMYFKGNPDVWFLASGYEDYAGDFKEIGVTSQVQVWRTEPNWDGHVRLIRSHGYHARGRNGFDPMCSIDGLEFALNDPNTERAKFIWEDLLNSYQHYIDGTVEYSSRQDYSTIYRTEKQVSKMGELVREIAWLPNKHGEFVVPRKITLDELPDDFSRNAQLADKLEMQNSVQAILEEALDKANVSEREKQQFNQALELVQRYPKLLDNPERLDELMREAATEQTNEDNSVLGRVDSPGDIRGTVNVPHSGSRTDRQSGETHINNGSQLERHDIEKAAMDAVMQKEKDLGNAPRDVSNSRGLGYDIESHTPEGGSRFIEVKGHSSDDGSVTLTRNEMHCALNNPEQFILALVKVADGCPEPPRYLPGNSWMESVTFSSLRKLLELCQDPS